ncbi:hypothetical protein OG524_03945 [Streptomyces sp. NBC_01520]|uniref:hypothetical protein n=1 Tax=Streptomyces sp. NBC_01520 TaxID=2903892 RepID=UPI00386EDA83
MATASPGSPSATALALLTQATAPREAPGPRHDSEPRTVRPDPDLPRAPLRDDR